MFLRSSRIGVIAHRLVVPNIESYVSLVLVYAIAMKFYCLPDQHAAYFGLPYFRPPRFLQVRDSGIYGSVYAINKFE